MEEVRKTAEQDAQLKFGLKGFPSQIQLDVSEPSAIISKQVDPQAAMGYLVFKDEPDYNSWMSKELFMPTQDQVLEALHNGSGS